MDIDHELKLMRDAYHLLSRVDKSGRVRIITWLRARLEVDENVTVGEAAPAVDPTTELVSSAARNPVGSNTRRGIESFSEYLANFRIETQYDFPLVAARFLELVGKEEFRSFDLSRAFKSAGIKVSNLTRLLSQLEANTPALILRLQKNGTTQQAQRSFKLSKWGRDKVESLRR